ncbi:MAG: MFS transporter [Anaerolineae bacterium]|nr:MFS transporter [Anaerolineae bacterium]
MATKTDTQTQAAASSSPLHNRDFRLLWLGGTAVSLGVQFYAVGLIWLVLYLTGSGVQLGLLLTVMAVPRAVSMLFSGALIDRYPPRLILMVSALVNGLLMTVLLVLLGAGWMSMAALLLIAPVSGLVDATFYPANTALVPRLVGKHQLAPANALIQTADTLANIAGPSLGGIIIGEVGRWAGAPEAGLMAGFAINVVLFAFGFAVFLGLSRRTDHVAPPTDDIPAQPAVPLGRAVLDGIRYALGVSAIRVSLMLIALINFAAIGPIVVGGALLVERRFGGDATMYGLISGGFGVGMLVGGALAAVVGQLRRPGLALVYTSFAMAAGLVALAFAPGFWVAFGTCVFIGVFGAFTNVNSVTWIQVKTAPHMQGRVGSLLVFAAVALDPFSNALSGVLAEIDVVLLFCGAAGLIVVGAVSALLNPALREETPPESGGSSLEQR